MYRMVLLVAIFGLAWTVGLYASDPEPIQTPGFNERLNDFLGSEGGVQVYVDPEGNVGTLIDPPGGARRFTVQPPQSPSINLGPPLQLENPGLHVPPASAPLQPPLPDFPQKAR